VPRDRCGTAERYARCRVSCKEAGRNSCIGADSVVELWWVRREEWCIDTVMTERDACGRFLPGNQAAKGNRGGPGRKARPVELRYLKAMYSVVDKEAWKQIVERAVKDGQGTGPEATAARRWLANYLIGRPVERQIIQVGAMDARERELLSELSELYRSMSEEESDDTSSDAAST